MFGLMVGFLTLILPWDKRKKKRKEEKKNKRRENLIYF